MHACGLSHAQNHTALRAANAQHLRLTYPRAACSLQGLLVSARTVTVTCGPSCCVLQIGCGEFTLLVVLLCAGVAKQQLPALHAYTNSISVAFTGNRKRGGFTHLRTYHMRGSSVQNHWHCCPACPAPFSSRSSSLIANHDLQHLLSR